MEIVINNFYLLEVKDTRAKPIVISENYEEDDLIEKDNILQSSIAQVARSLGNRSYKLEYKGVYHYIKKVDEKLIVIGFILESGSEAAFLATMGDIIDDIDFKSTGIHNTTDPEEFEEISDQIIEQIFDEVEKTISITEELTLDSRLSKAIVTI